MTARDDQQRCGAQPVVVGGLGRFQHYGNTVAVDMSRNLDLSR